MILYLKSKCSRRLLIHRSSAYLAFREEHLLNHIQCQSGSRQRKFEK